MAESLKYNFKQYYGRKSGLKLTKGYCRINPTGINFSAEDITSEKIDVLFDNDAKVLAIKLNGDTLTSYKNRSNRIKSTRYFHCKPLIDELKIQSESYSISWDNELQLFLIKYNTQEGQ